MYGWAGAGAGSAYTKTSEGKLIVAAFVDGYNQLVKPVRNDKAQTVKGGPGTGGTLGVQGGRLHRRFARSRFSGLAAEEVVLAPRAAVGEASPANASR